MSQKDDSRHNPRRSARLGITLFAFTLAGAACSTENSQKSAQGGTWAPKKDIRIVVHASPGGSSDLMARKVADILSREKIIGKSVIVENRPGGSGAVAYTYLRSQSRNPHVLSTISGTYLGTPASGQANYCYTNYTHLAILALDASMLVVSADSPYKTLDDLVRAAKNKPGGLRFGGTQSGGADSVMHALLQEKTGTKLSYVSFGGGGEVNAALLGRNVDVATGDPAEIQGLIKAGRLRGLGVSAAKPIKGLDVRTFQEQGVDLVFTQARGLIAPSDITEAQRSYWDKALTKMTNSSKWQQYLSEHLLVPERQTGQNAEQYVAKEWGRYVQMFRKLGFTPNPACRPGG